MRNRLYFIAILFFTLEPGRTQTLPRPSPDQLAWQLQETTAFLHFGTVKPDNFNPVHFDAGQIVRSLKAAGLKTAILTAKHNAGFCLWPSKFTNFTVAASRYKGGKGDIVKELADSCRAYGVRFGIYLCPWDTHEPTYGTPAYNEFFKNQLRELLTNYGDIAEVWFDGYKAPHMPPMDYDFPGYFALVRQLQPHAVIFSDLGPDLRWVGNERGNAAETTWSMIDPAKLKAGGDDAAYLHRGDSTGSAWMPAETDVSIRSGWFYNPAQDTTIKSGKALVNLYYQSVGRNSELLLNVPPNFSGVISDADNKSLVDFRSILDETFRTNLALGKVPAALTDHRLSTYETLAQGASKTWDLGQPTAFDRVCLQENIAGGQRQAEGKLEYWDGSAWQLIADFTTVGYKRLLRIPLVTTNKVRYTVVKSLASVQLAEFGLYKASSRE
jgi:alpha-L-fucosidase